MKLTPVRRLNPNGIYSVSRVTPPHDQITWQSTRCSACNVQLIGLAPGVMLHCEQSHDLSGNLSQRTYPLPLLDFATTEDAVRTLGDLPVCLINHRSEEGPTTWSLGLTAHLSDPTWEIVEAYMRLGFLPPFVLIEVSGLPIGLHLYTATTRWLLAGARETARLIGKRSKATVVALGKQKSLLRLRRPRREVNAAIRRAPGLDVPGRQL